MMSRNPQLEGGKEPNSVMPSNSSSSSSSSGSDHDPNPNESPLPLPLPLPQPPPKVVGTARGYTRTLHARLVTFRCEWCSGEREVWQYPGAAPRYCEGCREEARQAMNSARQREKRERERQAAPYMRAQPVGRPRKRW